MANYSVSFRITQVQYDLLQEHLFPGDGKESVAIILCGRSEYDSTIVITAHKLITIPIDQCMVRTSTRVNWSTELLADELPIAVKRKWSIFKIHSHPNGLTQFSSIDDESDFDLFSSIYGWMDADHVHGSLIMLPSGEFIGRYFNRDLDHHPIDKFTLIGSDISIQQSPERTRNATSQEFQKRTLQAFGEGTTKLLNSLKIGVVGCSGTGSPVIEQLYRLGVGHLVIIDPDKVELKNLNRILNSRQSDADNEKYKVDVLSNAISETGLGTQVTKRSVNLYDDRDAILDIASCDLVFGCMDSVDGRHLLNLISTFYLVPYIDIGIKLSANGKGGIDQISGSIHYLIPGKSSLRTRGVYNLEDLRAAGEYRLSPENYKALKKEGYIANINENSPAVISVNMLAASLAVNDMLARFHRFRNDSNSTVDSIKFSLTDTYFLHDVEDEVDEYLSKWLGRGTVSPLFNLVELK